MMQTPHRPLLKRWLSSTLSLATILTLTQTTEVLSADSPQVALTLAPSKTNPRNSEGDFVTLKDGRILFIYTHFTGGGGDNSTAHLASRISADSGKSWSDTDKLEMKNDGKENMLQEPGLVELLDGRLMMWTRTNGGSQFISYSKDRGETWTKLAPSSLISPVSPASIERLPKTKELIAVWNDHSAIPKELRGKRTPLSIALSKDDGKTWQAAKTLYDLATGWYCYTAIEFTDNDILLGHCAGDTSKGGIKVEIRDTNGKAIPGYSAADCDEVFGDTIKRPVTWKDHGSDVSGLAGKTVRLHFTLRDADLYSFHFVR
ncbi:MAG: glycoside hydrolase [Verrucomicrobiales bacterium]|nr:glycoside hydrolase [Verrucomicrobiales bacterium]